MRERLVKYFQGSYLCKIRKERGESILSKRFYILLLLATVITMIFIVGCSNMNHDDNEIALISSKPDSEHQNTFEDLQLGTLFDFDLKLLRADKSWVYIWIEGYQNGKAVEPSPLMQLSYGFSPEQVEESRMGFGILNLTDDEQQFLLYSSGAQVSSNKIDQNLLSKYGVRTWAYAIGDKKIGLESGKEMLLAVYRQGEESLRAGYDYQDSASINKMIKEDTSVILLKIKVEEKSKQ